MDLDPRCWIYLIPPLVAERFGQKALGVNYGVLFCGYSAAAFTGPRLGAFIGATHHGSYRPAFFHNLGRSCPWRSSSRGVA